MTSMLAWIAAQNFLYIHKMAIYVVNKLILHTSVDQIVSEKHFLMVT